MSRKTELQKSAFWVEVWLTIALIASWFTIIMVIVSNVKEWIK